MNDEIQICDERIHEAAKRDWFTFAMATVRMPDHEDKEQYRDGLDGDQLCYRSCRYCPSTLAMKVNDIAMQSEAA